MVVLVGGPLFNRRGVAIIPMIVSLVCVFALSTVAFALWHNGFNAQDRDRTNSDMQSLATTIRMVLGNPGWCATRYPSLTASDSILQQESFHFHIKDINTIKSPVTTAKANAKAYLGLINFGLANYQGLPITTTTLPVPIYLVYDDAGNLLSCRATAFVNYTQMVTVESEACATIKNNPLSQYDPGLDACT